MLFSSSSTLVLSSVTSFPPEAGFALGPEPALILGGTPVAAREVEVVDAILALPARGLVTPALVVVVPEIEVAVL